MNFRSLLFFVLFGCAACAPVQPTSDIPLQTLKPLPDLPPNRPSPDGSLGSQGGPSYGHSEHDDLIQQFPQPPGASTCGVKKAWEGRGKLIQGWPDVDEAHETTYNGKPAVITKDTVSLSGNYFILNDLNALSLTDQLLKYTTERNGPHMTYYIVRKRVGDSWHTASLGGLSLTTAESFITTANEHFREQYGIVPEKSKNVNDNMYVYYKNTNGNAYIGAVPISWKRSSRLPRNKLRKVNAERYYCAEKWK